jgi:hypothetical protein
MDPVTWATVVKVGKLIKEVGDLGYQIYKFGDASDKNPILHDRLFEHVKIALDSVKFINGISSPSVAFVNLLRNLEEILQECQTFLEKFRKQNKFKQYIYGWHNKKKFEELNQRLNDHKNRVLFGMVAYSFGQLSKMDQQQRQAISYNAGVQLPQQSIVQPRYNQTISFVCMQ